MSETMAPEPTQLCRVTAVVDCYGGNDLEEHDIEFGCTLAAGHGPEPHTEVWHSATVYRDLGREPPRQVDLLISWQELDP